MADIPGGSLTLSDFASAGIATGGGGASVATSEPVVTFVTSGTINYGDPITIEIVDADVALEAIVVIVTWEGGVREVAYDGAFGSRYTGDDNVTSAITDGTSITLLRDGGWPGSVVSVRVIASSNATADETEEYAVTVAQESSTTTASATVSVDTLGAIDLLLGDGGDLAIDGGDLALTSGPAGTKQAIGIRLRFYREEWFADLDAGIPYYQEILVKNPSLAAARETYRRALLSAPGVTSIESLDLNFDTASRELEVDWRVNTSYDDTVEGSA